jgi:hypothetical protein
VPELDPEPPSKVGPPLPLPELPAPLLDAAPELLLPPELVVDPELPEVPLPLLDPRSPPLLLELLPPNVGAGLLLQ